jgi:hypothetical protein
MTRQLTILWFCLLVAACATVGKKFDTTHVNDIVNGRQDKQQIQAWFGSPSQVVSPLSRHPAGCTERWQWTYAHAVAGGRTTSESLVVDFNAAGKVCDHAYSKMNQ